VEWFLDLLMNLHWSAVGQIIMIDILLGGDNAVVIALACRNLPPEQRMKGVFWGTFGAIALRVVLITFAVLLLDLPLLKAVGGALLLWIGVKLLIPETDDDISGKVKAASKLFDAIKTIIIADFVMSLDNVIAIAGAAEQAQDDHQTLLVIFGLLVSVPFIVGGSQVIMKLIDRFPIIVWFGGGLLGWIAGGLFASDAWMVQQFPQLPGMVLPLEIAGAAVVVAIGFVIMLLSKRRKQQESQN
jgi:YjbE family integral membrane protein